MKQHAFITAILMLLAFSAGWLLHDQSLEKIPAQLAAVDENKKMFSAIEMPLENSLIDSLDNKKNQSTAENISSSLDDSVSVLRALLEATKFQPAIDCYRDALQKGDASSDLRLYQVIQTYLSEQFKQEGFTHVLDFSSIFLALYPRDYPVTLLSAKAHLALGERRKAIELFYGIVPYVSDEKEQKKILDMIHELAAKEYAVASNELKWKELEFFYQYLLMQETNFWQYYLQDAIVLMNLQDYTHAENQLLLLLNNDEFKEQAKQLLARIKLLRAGGAVLPLQQYGNNYVSAVTFNGLTATNLVLDTGASLSVLDPAIFEKLTAGDYELVREGMTLQTANGPALTSVYRIHEIQLGHYRLENVEFAVLPIGNKNAEFSGLLGMNILNRFRFEIDQNNKELILQPNL